MFHARSYDTFEEVKSNFKTKKIQATNQGFYFHGDSSSNSPCKSLNSI